MKPPKEDTTYSITSIARQAEFERWSLIRRQTKRQLIRSISIGFCYLIASLSVGAYLLKVILDLSRDVVRGADWYTTGHVDLQWMQSLLWGYGAIAVVATVGYVLLLLIVLDRIPIEIYPWLSVVPWVGPTARMIIVGAYCQSIYRSVLGSETYSQAFQNAARTSQRRSLERWSKWASERLNAGHKPSDVLMTAPLLDQPLCAVAVFLNDELSPADTIRVWHRATDESHLLIESRLGRAVLFVSVTCMLASVIIASFALFLSTMLIFDVIQEFLYY